MKPYACYPGGRTRFQPMRSNFVTPKVSFVPGTETKDTRPSANIVRKDGAYEIQLAVPGLSKEQIKLEVIEDHLIVSAIKEDATVAGPKFLRQDYDYTGFTRKFRLHRNANSAALKASFHQGILTIVIPDKEPESIKINIQ